MTKAQFEIASGLAKCNICKNKIPGGEKVISVTGYRFKVYIGKCCVCKTME